MKVKFATTLLSLCFITLNAQTIQFQFCGKTEPVTVLANRDHAAIKLDFIKIGVRGGSQSAPFYVLGNQESVADNNNFKDKTIADNCPASSSKTDCSSCGTCTNVDSTTALNIGNAIGKLVGTVKVETKSNDIYIMSTGVDNVVCYETHKISLAGKANKKLDVYYKYEGIAKDNVSQVRNISLNYRFNNDAYFTTPYFFNKNSNNVGVFEDVGSILASVPVATEDLSKKLSFSISPNPTKEKLIIHMTVFQNFNGFINILGTQGNVVYSENISFDTQLTNREININQLTTGTYILHVSDDEGRVSVLKFQKQ